MLVDAMDMVRSQAFLCGVPASCFFNFCVAAFLVDGCAYAGFSAAQFERAAALSPWDSHINAALRACKDTLRLVPMEVREWPV
jgi:hypothetical protein